MIWLDLYFINFKIFGSSFKDGLELGEIGYRENSKLGVRNEDMEMWIVLNREVGLVWR